jgi:hypothetical protein
MTQQQREAVAGRISQAGWRVSMSTRQSRRRGARRLPSMTSRIRIGEHQ